MSSSKGGRPRKILGYEAIYLSQRTAFDVGEYVQNPSMIKKLHEEREIAHAYSDHLEKRLEEKINSSTELEIKVKVISTKLDETNNNLKKMEEANRQLNLLLEEKNKQIAAMQDEKSTIQIKLTQTEVKLDEVSRSSFVQFLVSVMATVLLGFGVNIVTTTPSSWIGWVLIVASIVLSIVAFIFVRKSK
jgi:hypothetical protein